MISEKKETCPRAHAVGSLSSSSHSYSSFSSVPSARGKTRRGTKHTPRHKPTLGNPSSGPQGVSVSVSKETPGSSADWRERSREVRRPNLHQHPRTEDVSVSAPKRVSGSSVCAGVGAGGLGIPPGVWGTKEVSPTETKETRYLVSDRSRSKTPNILVISRRTEYLPPPLGTPVAVKPLSQ